ncbi:phage neck terminator protein [Methylorubrum suomiense]|uniref:Phage neck terminator protein gp12-like domain-containing protein n=1 Tax=Methylorubrum suomiense TaxID=144191 RepID=A0ABQ4UY58_9HYPH|nr:hypothetical protein [Methylorubrum suomiense]GJE77281.1 hypothetical protein BGCPKDLD_3884 [Methylorubrum suomiense]
MTEDEAFDRLRALLVAVNAESVLLGQTKTALTDIILHHQRAPMPEGAYAGLTPLGSTESGDGYSLCYETITLDGVERVVEVRTIGISYGWRIDIYASRPRDHADAFHAALWSARAQLDLLPAVVSEIGEIKQSAERIQENWEGRANFTVTLSAARQQRTLIDVIERGHINFTGSGGPTTIRTSLDYAKD